MYIHFKRSALPACPYFLVHSCYSNNTKQCGICPPFRLMLDYPRILKHLSSLDYLCSPPSVPYGYVHYDIAGAVISLYVNLSRKIGRGGGRGGKLHRKLVIWGCLHAVERKLTNMRTKRSQNYLISITVPRCVELLINAHILWFRHYLLV